MADFERHISPRIQCGPSLWDGRSKDWEFSSMKRCIFNAIFHMDTILFCPKCRGTLFHNVGSTTQKTSSPHLEHRRLSETHGNRERSQTTSGLGESFNQWKKMPVSQTYTIQALAHLHGREQSADKGVAWHNFCLQLFLQCCFLEIEGSCTVLCFCCLAANSCLMLLRWTHNQSMHAFLSCLCNLIFVGVWQWAELE